MFCVFDGTNAAFCCCYTVACSHRATNTHERTLAYIRNYVNQRSLFGCVKRLRSISLRSCFCRLLDVIINFNFVSMPITVVPFSLLLLLIVYHGNPQPHSTYMLMHLSCASISGDKKTVQCLWLLSSSHTCAMCCCAAALLVVMEKQVDIIRGKKIKFKSRRCEM